MAIRPRELSLKLHKFCAEYLKNGGNGTRAVISAGYKTKHPDVRANEILRIPKVQEFLSKKTEKIFAKEDITVEYILGKIKELAEVCTKKVQITDMKGNVKGERAVDATAANKALENLGRYKAMFVDKTQVDFDFSKLFEKIRERYE